MSISFCFRKLLSKEKLKLEVIWGALCMATFFVGGVVWLSFGFGFFVFFFNRAAFLMDESCGCDLWHLIASSLSEGICVIRLLASFRNYLELLKRELNLL